jgi:hypothetical protein
VSILLTPVFAVDRNMPIINELQTGIAFARDRLIRTTKVRDAPTERERRQWNSVGGHMAESFFGASWLLVLLFSAGGVAGMLLASLMHMASASARREGQHE